MEDKKNKRKLFKRIGAIVCAVAVTIVAFSLPFLGGFRAENRSNCMVASADEIVATEFEGSSVSVALDGRGEVIKYPYVGTIRFVFNSSGSTVFVFHPRYGATTFSFALNPTGGVLSGVTTQLNNPSSLLGVPIEYVVNGPFDFSKIAYCQIQSYFYGNNFYSQVGYFDGSGNSVLVNVICESRYVNVIPVELTLGVRQYVLNSTFSDSDSYNSGYSMGYNKGYSVGESVGSEAGYNSGYSAGQSIGYNSGYSAGVEAGSNYSFFSLISAVIDAPIQAFMGLFNFELLGINLAGFFTGLLTLAFIITIVRLVMP